MVFIPLCASATLQFGAEYPQNIPLARTIPIALAAFLDAILIGGIVRFTIEMRNAAKRREHFGKYHDGFYTATNTHTDDSFPPFTRGDTDADVHYQNNDPRVHALRRASFGTNTFSTLEHRSSSDNDDIFSHFARGATAARYQNNDPRAHEHRHMFASSNACFTPEHTSNNDIDNTFMRFIGATSDDRYQINDRIIGATNDDRYHVNTPIMGAANDDRYQVNDRIIGGASDDQYQVNDRIIGGSSDDRYQVNDPAPRARELRRVTFSINTCSSPENGSYDGGFHVIPVEVHTAGFETRGQHSSNKDKHAHELRRTSAGNNACSSPESGTGSYDSGLHVVPVEIHPAGSTDMESLNKNKRRCHSLATNATLLHQRAAEYDLIETADIAEEANNSEENAHLVSPVAQLTPKRAVDEIGCERDNIEEDMRLFMY